MKKVLYCVCQFTSVRFFEMNNENIKYLNKINSPSDLKNIPADEMDAVAQEIRSELVRIVSQTGGHLASNLGIVEATMAIHRVFDSPKDHVIFDVGHQSYVHKFLTGRYAQMETLRKSGGISGFTKRGESEHDCFGAGHSSTSLSAGLGFAISDKLKGSDAYTVVVVGDGAYTGGMIHEALNNCRKDLNLIIILNENEMSISKNIGRFATSLSKLRTKPGYFKTKRTTGNILNKIPLVGKPIYRLMTKIKRAAKSALYASNYFENMGLKYLGPIDGNDYAQVEGLLLQAKALNESVIVHLKTVKGKGYSPAETAPDFYHGVSPCAQATSGSVSFSNAMGQALTSLAEGDPRICAITAAMCDGTGLNSFRETFPDRFFDVGIAEEHALTFAAGLAANGMRPFVAIYSTFLQRGFDNIAHDIALQNLPVIMCIDRAGLNAADGATHHGIFDVSFLSEIPNVKIFTPITNDALVECIKEALNSDCPCAIRYPNGYENSAISDRFYGNGILPLGAKSDFSSEDNVDAVIVTHGRIVCEAVKAAEAAREKGIAVGVILLEALKPYDAAAKRVSSMIPATTKAVVFLEEEIRSGGMGVNLCEKLIERNAFDKCRYSVMAVNDSFVDNRPAGEHIYKTAGVDSESVLNEIERMLK